MRCCSCVHTRTPALYTSISRCGRAPVPPLRISPRIHEVELMHMCCLVSLAQQQHAGPHQERMDMGTRRAGLSGDLETKGQLKICCTPLHMLMAAACR